MPTKPSVTVTEFASNATYAGLIGDAAVLNGTATKIDGGAAFRSNGAAPLSPLNAQWANYDWNVWSLLLNWLNLGTNAADEDAHVVETDADGRVNAAFGYFTDGAAVSPVVQIDVTGSNDGLSISGTGALTADGAVVDFSGASGGTALNVLGSTSATEAAIEAIGGGNAPAVSATSDSGTGASTASNTAIAGATTTGKGVLALSFGAGDALTAQCTSTSGRGVFIDGTSGGARTVPLVDINSAHTGATAAALQITQSGAATAVFIDSTHSGAGEALIIGQSGSDQAIQIVHTGASGGCIRADGSVSSTSSVIFADAINTSANALVGRTSASSTGGNAVFGDGRGNATAVLGISAGTGYALFGSASGTGTAIRAQKSANATELVTNAGANVAMTQYSSDASVSGSLLQLWGRSIASLSRLAMTYVSGAGRLFVHGSKHGYVYGISDEYSGSEAEPTGSTALAFGPWRYVQDAFPVTTGGNLWYRINGRVTRSVLGTFPDLTAFTIELYDVTASATISGVKAISLTPVANHWTHFCIEGKYTIPATGDRQFEVRAVVAGPGAGGTLNYENIVAEVWQEERRT